MSKDYHFGIEAVDEILAALGISHITGVQRLIFTAGEGEFPIIFLQFAPNADMMEALGNCQPLIDASELDVQRIYEMTGHTTHLKWIEDVVRKELIKVFDQLTVSATVKAKIAENEIEPTYDEWGQSTEDRDE